MAEHATCYVHADGDTENVYFVLPPMAREMRKNDEFTHTDPSGTETRYKVKSVDYRIEQVTQSGVGGDETVWRPPTVWYGVRVVP